MLYNLSNPETVVYREPKAPTAEIGDYLNFSLIQIDNKLPYDKKVSHYNNIRDAWNNIIKEIKMMDGFKYDLNWFQLNNSNPLDVDKFDINLVVVSTIPLPDLIINKIKHLEIKGEAEFVFSIQNSNTSITYGLANGPYGGAVVPVEKSRAKVLNYLYIFEKSDALKINLKDTVDKHGAILLTTHSMSGAETIKTRDGPRKETHFLDIIGVHTDFIGKDGKEYTMYASVQIYDENVIAGLNGHLLAPAPTAQLEIAYEGNAPEHLVSMEFLYNVIFGTLLVPEVVKDPKLSAIDQFSAASMNPNFDDNLTDITGLLVTNSLVNLWNNYAKTKYFPEISYVKALVATGFYPPIGAAGYFFPEIKDGEILTYQVLFFLLTSTEVFNGEFELLNKVSGKNATRENLLANGLVTVN